MTKYFRQVQGVQLHGPEETNLSKLYFVYLEKLNSLVSFPHIRGLSVTHSIPQ